MITSVQRNRYPGVRPFERDQQDLFFGRGEDIERLLSLLLQERLSVLFGKSGHGKSSLLNAGVIPALAEKSARGRRRYLPVSVRFGTWTKEEKSTLVDKFVNFLNSGMKEAGIPGAERLPALPHSLWGAVKRWNPGPDTGLVLIFDQFEEFFSYPAGQQDAFKEQLAELLYADYPQFLEDQEDRLSPEQAAALAEKTDVRALFAIRADRLGDLDRLKDRLPAILNKRYELRALEPEQARAAIVGPAAEGAMLPDRGRSRYACPAFSYSGEALATILRELTGKEGTEQGRVEGFLLQIVCASIEKRVAQGRLDTVTPGELPDFDTVFDDYYQDRIQDLPEAERPLSRRVLEQGLLLVDPHTGDARRLSKDAGELAQAYEVSATVLHNLEKSYLIRREVNSLGNYTYEISHDTLIAPILKARREQEALEDAARREQEARAEAERLERERREADARAREAERRAAEEQRRAEESERLKNQAVSARRKASRFAWSAMALAVVSVLAMGLAGLQWQQANASFKKADESLKKMETAEKARKATEVRKYLDAANRMVAICDTVMARRILEDAIKIDTTNHALRDSIKTFSNRCR